MVVTESVLHWFREKRQRKILAVLLFIVLPFVAGAESTLEFHTHLYDMGPGLRITKPQLSYTNPLSLDTEIKGRFTVDQVVTSEVDSMSGASQYFGLGGGKIEYRQEYMGSVMQTMGEWKLNAAYVLSIEEDYRSNTPSMTLSRDFNLRNTTLSAGYAHNFDWVKGTYMSEAEDKNVHNYSLSLTQVISKVSLLQVGYTLQDNYGFLATGNRKIVLANDSEIDEYLPSTRVRQAIGVRYLHWLPMEVALDLGYRYYYDDWELDSHTLETRLYHNFNDRLSIKAEYRYYTQQAVYFAKDVYDGTERYLTAATSLRSLDAHLLGLKLGYDFRWRANDWKLEAKYERYEQSSGLEGNIYMLSFIRKTW